MLTRLSLIAAGLAAASSAFSYDLNVAGTNYGTFSGRLLFQTMLSGEDNGWDPNVGTSYSVMGK